MKKVTCIDKDNNKFEVPVSELSFRPAVYAVIIKDDKILLSKQWDGYDFPGGGMELGETIEETLKREVREETGLEVRLDKVVACENSFFKLPMIKEDRFVHSILIYYLCEITGGEFTIKNLDEYEKEYADMPEWVSLSEIDKIKFYNSVDSIEIIKKALEVK